jgi:hypothetical protein
MVRRSTPHGWPKGIVPFASGSPFPMKASARSSTRCMRGSRPSSAEAPSGWGADLAPESKMQQISTFSTPSFLGRSAVDGEATRRGTRLVGLCIGHRTVDLSLQQYIRPSGDREQALKCVGFSLFDGGWRH